MVAKAKYMYFISYYGTPLVTFEVYVIAIDIESKHAAYIWKYESFDRWSKLERDSKLVSTI